MEADVIVLGTGAAGLTAALAAHGHGADVLVLEKSDKVGGTSAWSGGMIWIPCNHHMREAGLEDSREEALTYLEALSHDLIDPVLAEAFVDTGPEMVEWMESNTPVQFQLVPNFPDYHPEHPGGKPGGGRSLECPLFSYDTLEAHRELVTVGYNYGTAPITMEESNLGRAVPIEVPEEERARRAERDERGCGQALMGRLFKGCIDRNIPVRTGYRATRLLLEDGAVAGVAGEGPDGPFEVDARGGVVLATGGFEWNRELVRTFLRGPMTSPVSVPTNEGDGLTMSMRIGAALGNMREAWWMPAVEIPGDRGDGRPHQHLFASERARPRSIMVNRAGRRFTNEAANYNAFGAAFHEQDVARFDYANLPCWFIFDQKHLDTYGFIGTEPGAPAANWVANAPTLRALAAQLGIDPDGLEETVATWNSYAEAGRDPDFHRGESAHDTWWGDPWEKGTPGATLGPLDTGPFYAVEVRSGALGTKGGPKTDGLARVQNVDGETIAGLYAAGNVMASAMGMTYGGAGGTLAPGMVFGFLAGRDAAARAAASR
ncbi:MAG: FAD-dependent oxidoreductase [Pseudomonadales bacterium]|nr:FAD-dependent oxidoreductase [Pseudomonadales bacterium]NIX07141.1 FAD-dependent oxidoreductase [Pseudomonadales bacterium]